MNKHKFNTHFVFRRRSTEATNLHCIIGQYTKHKLSTANQFLYSFIRKTFDIVKEEQNKDKILVHYGGRDLNTLSRQLCDVIYLTMTILFWLYWLCFDILDNKYFSTKPKNNLICYPGYQPKYMMGCFNAIFNNKWILTWRRFTQSSQRSMWKCLKCNKYFIDCNSPTPPTYEVSFSLDSAL